MQEYRVHEPNPKRNSTSDARLDEWVLCRIYKRDGQKDKDGDLDRQPNEKSPTIGENLATIACDYEENLATAMTCDYEENLATMQKDKDSDLDLQPNENPKACDYEENLATAMTCDYEENLATIQKDKDGDLDQQPNENSPATDKACDYEENLATMACDYIGMGHSNGLMKRLGIDLTQTSPPIFPSLAICNEDNHATMACDNIDITQSNEGLMDRSSIWENSIIPSVYSMGNGFEKKDLLEDWDFWQDGFHCDW
ncbi:hypothetical protein ACJIZ3_023139 [Penstemon smallii]|uniref:NAC domain-containing protein n=1 Tax=Penstemon smallii TaxID=265156 RepID=A0ABD3TR57_9LAMI